MVGIPSLLLELIPYDSSFFGDSRGLGRGGQGSTLRFPTPWTLSGAALYLYAALTGDWSSAGASKSEAEEERGEATDFTFYGPFLRCSGRLWFWPPQDVVVRDVGGRKALRVLQPVQRDARGYHRWLPPIVQTKEDEPVSGMLSLEALRAYLKEKPEIGDPVRDVVSLSEERRLGLTISETTGTSEQGLLYTSVHLRPPKVMVNGGVADISFCALISRKSGEELRELDGIVRLGGEGRPARVTTHTMAEPLPWLQDEELEAGDVVKLVLLSPAIYRDGRVGVSHPDLSGLPGRPEYVRVNGHILWIVGRPWKLSGWSLKARRARPMYSAAPPGSVYYVRLGEPASRLELTLAFWRRSLFWERGFGSPMVVRASPSFDSEVVS